MMGAPLAAERRSVVPRAVLLGDLCAPRRHPAGEAWRDAFVDGVRPTLHHRIIEEAPALATAHSHLMCADPLAACPRRYTQLENGSISFATDDIHTPLLSVPPHARVHHLCSN